MGPMIRATVKLEQMQIQVMHAFSEAIAPMAEDIKKQVEHAIETMDFQAEFDRMMIQEIRDAMKRKAKDVVEEIMNSDEFVEQGKKIGEAKICEGLTGQIERVISNEIEWRVRQEMADLFKDDIKNVVEQQMAKYKNQKGESK